MMKVTFQSIPRITGGENFWACPPFCHHPYSILLKTTVFSFSEIFPTW